MTFWHDNKFKKLQKHWDDKLKEVGFVDAEKTTGSTRVLIQNSPNAYKQAPKVTRDKKLEYYDLLNKNLHKKTTRPKDWVERLVMIKAAQGATKREISEELKKLNQRCHRQTVAFIIRKYEAKWKIKKWAKYQLNPNTAWGKARTK